MDQPRDNRLNANCYCIKSGRQMSYFEVEITDGGGRPVASVTTTGMHLSGEKAIRILQFCPASGAAKKKYRGI